MITRVNGGWCTYDLEQKGEDRVLTLKALKLTHPEHIYRVTRELAEGTFCTMFRVPSEIWTRYSPLYWHEAGFMPPIFPDELMVWEPQFIQTDFLGKVI